MGGVLGRISNLQAQQDNLTDLAGPVSSSAASVAGGVQAAEPQGISEGKSAFENLATQLTGFDKVIEAGLADAGSILPPDKFYSQDDQIPAVQKEVAQYLQDPDFQVGENLEALAERLKEAKPEAPLQDTGDYAEFAKLVSEMVGLYQQLAQGLSQNLKG